VAKDDEKGQVYSAEHDAEWPPLSPTVGRQDRHQFRFIVSAEDRAELSDLRETARSLMTQMEADLGTQLDWIAVDHYNTGHPHTHILVCGVTEDGKTHNIAGDYCLRHPGTGQRDGAWRAGPRPCTGRWNAKG
jgi:type IV secretory pathway VirD2 relaxase